VAEKEPEQNQFVKLKQLSITIANQYPSSAIFAVSVLG